MSESGRSAETHGKHKEKEKDKKHHEDQTGYQAEGQAADPDPYCCTPPGGDTGADTKP